MSDTPTFHIPATPTDALTPLQTDGPRLELAEILDLAIEKEASDIHFGGDERIGLRIYGEIRFVDGAGFLAPSQAEGLIDQMLTTDERAVLRTRLELDFSYTHTDGTAFRCNAFFRRGKLSIAMRRIAKSVPAIEELHLPPAVRQLITAKQGLILVCGPTGSGKSTTLCAMLEEINATRVEHVVTIEDPIEYVFTNKRCIFSQRELHHDTHSFEAALRSAMRQDPDIVMIGEMRDAETITAALNLCETGHLVFSTLHTSGASQTMSRIAQAFPIEQRDAILGRIADSLLGVLSQRLVTKIGGGRVGLFELVLGTDAVKSSIRQGDLPQLENAIATSGETGMVTMKRSAIDLVESNVVDPMQVVSFIRDK